MLTWAGTLARADAETCAAAAALKYLDAVLDAENDQLRHHRLRRPQQNWPASYEKAVSKLVGTAWRHEAQDERAFKARFAKMNF